MEEFSVNKNDDSRSRELMCVLQVRDRVRFKSHADLRRWLETNESSKSRDLQRTVLGIPNTAATPSWNGFVSRYSKYLLRIKITDHSIDM